MVSCPVLYNVLRSKRGRIYPGHFRIERDHAKALKLSKIVRYNKITGSNQYTIDLQEKYRYMHTLFGLVKEMRYDEELMRSWEDPKAEINGSHTLSTMYFAKNEMLKFAFVNEMLLKDFRLNYPSPEAVPVITKVLSRDEMVAVRLVHDFLGSKLIPDSVIKQIVIEFLYGAEKYKQLCSKKINIHGHPLVCAVMYKSYNE